ncbi:hypothetical protein [Longispora albida]|uniref:hypothetical protein n=1 Tax=Longispora albida TaxID=203523 RepID=UPI0012FA62A5
MIRCAAVAETPNSIGAGFGSAPSGQDTEISRSPSRRRASGPVPPPEKLTGSTAAAGDTVPSAWARSAVSMAAHEPSGLRAHRGSAELSVLYPPPGLAKVCVVSERSPATSTRFAQALAIALAAAALAWLSRQVAGTAAAAGDMAASGGSRVAPSRAIMPRDQLRVRRAREDMNATPGVVRGCATPRT